jgi:hypothetical protein
MSVLRLSACRRAAVSVTGLVAVVLLAGCGGGSSPETAAAKGVSPSAGESTPSSSAGESTLSPSATTEPSAQPCTLNVKDPKDGYSVVLPCGYKRITSDKQFDKLIKASGVRANLPYGMLSQTDLFVLKPPAGSQVFLSIVDEPGATIDTLEGKQGALEKELKRMGTKNVSFSRTTAGGEAAMRVVMDAQTQLRSGDLVTGKEVQVYVPFDDRIFIWTFSDPKQSAPVDEKPVLDSMEFTGAAG